MGKKKVKKERRVKEDVMIVTVDMGKEKPYGYICTLWGEEVAPFAFTNTREGFTRLYQKIEDCKRQWEMREVLVGYESSGPYAEPLEHFLRNKPVKLVQVNPMHTKRIKEIEGNSPNKTDRKDVRVIADLMKLGHALNVVIPVGIPAELRRLSQARERAITRRARIVSQLGSIVYLLFPELPGIFPDLNSKSARYVLKTCPTPEQIMGLGEEEVTMRLHRVSRGRVGNERAAALYRAATESVGIREGVEGIAREVVHLAEELDHEEVFITQLEKQMTLLLKKVPCHQSILSIKGIGIVITAGIIGEVGDFQEFSSGEALLKLAGLNLYEISSGKHKGEKRITKRGRALLRKLLYYAALNVSRPGGALCEEYQELLGKGKPKPKALVIIMRKLVRIVFALTRDGSQYHESVRKRQAA